MNALSFIVELLRILDYALSIMKSLTNVCRDDSSLPKFTNLAYRCLDKVTDCYYISIPLQEYYTKKYSFFLGKFPLSWVSNIFNEIIDHTNILQY